MSKEEAVNWRVVWWTALAAIIPYTIINQIFGLIERNINSRAYSLMMGYYSRLQPDYFPLLFLIVLFFTVFAVVLAYSIVYSRLPSNWMLRGVIIGLFLFFVADFPFAVRTGYTTAMPGAVARGLAISGLLANLANGILIAYIHMKFSSGKKSKD